MADTPAVTRLEKLSEAVTDAARDGVRVAIADLRLAPDPRFYVREKFQHNDVYEIVLNIGAAGDPLVIGEIREWPDGVEVVPMHPRHGCGFRFVKPEVAR